MTLHRIQETLRGLEARKAKVEAAVLALEDLQAVAPRRRGRPRCSPSVLLSVVEPIRRVA